MAVVKGHVSHDEAIEAQRAKMSFLFREDVAPGLRLEMDLNTIFFAGESDFQKIDVVETYFGKVSTSQLSSTQQHPHVFR